MMPAGATDTVCCSAAGGRRRAAHLVKLVDAADAAVGEHERAALEQRARASPTAWRARTRSKKQSDVLLENVSTWSLIFDTSSRAGCSRSPGLNGEQRSRSSALAGRLADNLERAQTSCRTKTAAVRRAPRARVLVARRCVGAQLAPADVGAHLLAVPPRSAGRSLALARTRRRTGRSGRLAPASQPPRRVARLARARCRRVF